MENIFQSISSLRHSNNAKLLIKSLPWTSNCRDNGDEAQQRQKERGNIRDTDLKAQTSLLVLYFPQTHDLLKDSAPSATVANHLKQRNDRLSEEGKLFKGIVDLVV